MDRRARMTGWLRRRPREDADAARERRMGALSGVLDNGWAVCPAARPMGFGCSCDRIGCPSPGMHPISFAWQTQATADRDQVSRWFDRHPDANWVTATGVTHDVLDVPAAAGEFVLSRMTADHPEEIGPVVACGPERHLFFTATRGTPLDEDEWWPCELDCHPETLDEHPGLRWHCRGSYVLVPPSLHPSGDAVRWIRGPELPLPDPLLVLNLLTDACDVVGAPATDSHWLMGM